MAACAIPSEMMIVIASGLAASSTFSSG